MAKQRIQSIILLTIAVIFLTGATNESVFLVVRENESITIDHEVSYLQLKDNGKATLKKGAKIAGLQASGNSELLLGEDVEVSHLTASGNSIVRISGAAISFLTVVGNGQADIKQINIPEGSFIAPGISINGGAIVYAPGAKIQVYADNVSFTDGKLTGFWNNGERFAPPPI